MTIDDADLRAAWLAEMWGKCPELSRGERAAKVTADREWQRLMARSDAQVVVPESTEAA